MKKQYSLIVILACLSMLLLACSSNTETKATVTVKKDTTTSPTTPPEDSGKADTSVTNLESWYGVGIYSRCNMTTQLENGIMTVKIVWGNSAASNYEYNFSGEVQDDILTYDNLVEKEVVTDENNKVTDKQLNDHLSGQIYFKNSIALWNNSGSTVVLAKEDAYVEDASKLDYTGTYNGFGMYDRVSMDLSQKDSYIEATLYWSDSAEEQMQYTFSGTIEGSQVMLNNIQTKIVTIKEDGTKSEKVQSEDGSGTIYLSNGFVTVMNDDADFVIPLVKQYAK